MNVDEDWGDVFLYIECKCRNDRGEKGGYRNTYSYKDQHITPWKTDINEKEKRKIFKLKKTVCKALPV